MSEVEGQKAGRAELALSGLPGSPGVALRRCVVIDVGRTGVVHRHIAGPEVPSVLERFKSGVGKAAAELRELSAKAHQKAATKIEISVLEAYTLMVEDELLL